MERIKQAIEKVKAQRPGKPGVAAQSRHGMSFVPRAFQGRAELGEIAYEKTPVVRLKAEHLDRNRIVAFNKNDPRSISFDLLRTYVLQKMEENGWRTLAVTSPTPGAGKTVVAINLAMSIAQQPNKSAMLVDFDLRRPKVGAYLGLPMETSLNDVLDGTAELPDALANPDMQRLVVLPAKNPVRKSAETLSTSRVGEMVKDMRDRYDSRIVIFDLPPLLAADDAVIVTPHIDCVLMVVASGMSTQREIEDALHHIPPAKLVGTVLNRAESESSPYYYYA